MGIRVTFFVTACVMIAVLIFFELFVFRTSVSTTDPYFKTYHIEFSNTPTLLYNNTPTPSYNYSFSPPISMYHALLIALEGGGWDATSLKNMTVSVVGLNYCAFSQNGFLMIHPVTSLPADWSPQQVNGTTYRYVWTITVARLLYLVDAATAELFKFVFPAP